MSSNNVFNTHLRNNGGETLLSMVGGGQMDNHQVKMDNIGSLVLCYTSTRRVWHGICLNAFGAKIEALSF